MRTLRNTPAGFTRSAVSHLLIAATMFLSLPVHTIGQKSISNDDLQKAGPKIFLHGQANAMSNKMPANSYTEARAGADVRQETTVEVKAASGSSVVYEVLNVEFRTPAARRKIFTDLKQSTLTGAYVLTAIDRFADVFVDRTSAWTALQGNTDVLKVEESRRVEAPPPPVTGPSKLVSQAVAENIVRGGYHGLTGKNTIIAIVDTGIDFRHPDFISYDSAGLPTSRISYLWDTATEFQPGRGTPAPDQFPNGTSIGTLYTKEQLTAELRSAKVNIPPTDLDGHGTACASVAAGNGNADKQTSGLKRREVLGVAPEADIVGVRLGRQGLENSYLLNAISEWLDKVGQKTPVVMSGSFGGHYSGHDGQLVFERELNARFPLTKVGRAVVFAAGNEGDEPIHAKVNFTTPAKLVSWTAKEKTVINGFFDSADPKLAIYGTNATPLKEGLRQEVNPITNQLEIQITVEPGVGGIWLENTSGKPGEAHFYLMSDAYGSFSAENIVPSNLIGSPGAMENAITVGSYDWNDNFHSGGKMTNLPSVCRDNKTGGPMSLEIGWLSCYSSPGPLRNGVVKPEIVAPGEWFPSANAKNNGKSAGNWAMSDSTGYYRAMNGTSAATPYTSGIVALMFQKKPTLTLGEVRNLLKAQASKTGLTPYGSGIPNPNWGYGKLDAAAIDRIFAAL